MKHAKEIVELIRSSERIVITSHRSADGDSMGSSLAMLRFVRALGKDAVICHPDPCPDFLEWAKREDAVLDFETHHHKLEVELKHADLIFAMDYNGANRMGKDMGELFSKAKGKKVMIDHHPEPEDFVDIAVSHPEISSTCQILFEVIAAAECDELLNIEIAEALYLGMMTDTGSFRFNSVTYRTHEIVARLLKTGLDHTHIHESTYDNNRIDKLKLRGYAVAEKLEVIEKYQVAILTLTEEELERFNYVRGDTDGLVNVALSIEGVQVAVFFKEHYDKIKISFRSKGGPVNSIARDHFEGGGHKYAAGGISLDSLENTVNKFKSLLPEYFG